MSEVDVLHITHGSIQNLAMPTSPFLFLTLCVPFTDHTHWGRPGRNASVLLVLCLPVRQIENFISWWTLECRWPFYIFANPNPNRAQALKKWIASFFSRPSQLSSIKNGTNNKVEFLFAQSQDWWRPHEHFGCFHVKYNRNPSDGGHHKMIYTHEGCSPLPFGGKLHSWQAAGSCWMWYTLST